MMQKELHSLLKIRDETNQKIKTARVTLQWLESRLAVRQNQTTSLRQSSIMPERPLLLLEKQIISAAQMTQASQAIEDWLDGR